MIQHQLIQNDEFTPIYYTLVAYNKIRCMTNYWLGSNGFEANSIIDGVFLGNIHSVYDHEQLQQIGITHIISAIAGFEPPFPENYNYLVVDALDSENSCIGESFEPCCQFIKEAIVNNGKVLIHCMAGRSRSASIVGAYLIKEFGMNTDRAIAAMQNRRSIVQPNSAFVNQLKDFYNEMHGKNVEDHAN